MQAARLFIHRQLGKCHKLTDRRIRQRDVEMAARCGVMEFSLEGGEGDERLENVTTVRYLGRLLDQTDDDWPAVRRKIMHARPSGGDLGH